MSTIQKYSAEDLSSVIFGDGQYGENQELE